MVIILAAGIPYWGQAQDGRQPKFEINAGISTPRLASVIDRDSWNPFPSYISLTSEQEFGM